MDVPYTFAIMFFETHCGEIDEDAYIKRLIYTSNREKKPEN